jgi:hypothetical protein
MKTINNHYASEQKQLIKYHVEIVLRIVLCRNAIHMQPHAHMRPGLLVVYGVERHRCTCVHVPIHAICWDAEPLIMTHYRGTSGILMTGISLMARQGCTEGVPKAHHRHVTDTLRQHRGRR